VATFRTKLATGSYFGTTTNKQIKAGHIEPSNNSWNSPIFVIEKKS
jgi:hypothetical protein